MRKRLIDVVSRLPGHRKVGWYPIHLGFQMPPQYAHYKESIEIATILAKGYAQGQEIGYYSGYGYILNMEKIYESFIEKSLIKILNGFPLESAEIFPQHSTLFAKAETARSSYYTRPDNVIFNSGTPFLVIDAKYKTLEDADTGTINKPHNSDLYQLFASTISHNCRVGILVFPQTTQQAASAAHRIRQWSVPVTNPEILLFALELNMSDLSSIQRMREFDEGFLRGMNDILDLSIN